MRPIALYVHIPFCVRKCNYCDFASVAGRMDLLPAYLSMLERELAAQAAQWPDCTVQTVFLGGGTPSLLPADAYGPLMKAVRNTFPVLAEAEISLEANPGTVTAEKAEAMVAAGFNRVSVGVQAAQDELLQAMGRIHRRRDAEQAISLLLEAGFRNLNVDLMFGLPGQTLKQWRETLDFALGFPLSHLSFYSLSIEEGTPWGELYKQKKLEPASDELDRGMYREALKQLSAGGFVHYELSNAAKPGLWSRHNLIYWNRGEYLGIGAGAHSLMGLHRFANTTDPAEYVHRMQTGEIPVAETLLLSPADVLSERLFMGLRLLDGLDLALVGAETGMDVASRYAEELEQLVHKELLIRNGSVIKLSMSGLDYANEVFRAFV